MNQASIRKYVAEFFGTFTLVFLGCGTAMLLGCDTPGGYIATALAFGLVIVGMAYCVGNVSGCHINPAVSLAVFLNGGMTSTDLAGYVGSQCAGSLFGTVMLRILFAIRDLGDQTAADGKKWGMGANTLAGTHLRYRYDRYICKPCKKPLAGSICNGRRYQAALGVHRGTFHRSIYGSCTA